MDNLELEKLKTRSIMLSTRYNHSHDAKGRFASGSGSGGSGGAGTTTSDLKTQVENETKKVESRLSNEYKPFQKEAADMAKIKARGGLTDEEAQQALNVANKVYDKAAAAEPQITSDVISAVDNVGGKMYGLDFRMKQPTSMAGKIGADAKQDGVSFDKSGSDIKDAVRYTAVIDTDNFTDGYNKIKSSMENKGYKEVRCKNFYDMYANGKSEQKAVQCVYENKDGYKFEFQFHTPQSQGAKELNHPLYEKAREATTRNQERKRLKKKMKQIGTHVTNPPGVMSIKSHG